MSTTGVRKIQKAQKNPRENAVRRAVTVYVVLA